jgi:hypothetical protein
VADVLSGHVLFELESIDRMYLNMYVPQLQRAEGVLGFIHGHLGQPIASTAAIAPMSRDFVARLRAFADSHGIPRIDFARGQRKDDVMHEHLAAFEAAGRREGVLFIGRAQEKNTVFRTEKRRGADGRPYPWIVRTTSVVNQFYVHCVDEDFGAFFIKSSPGQRGGLGAEREERPHPEHAADSIQRGFERVRVSQVAVADLHLLGQLPDRGVVVQYQGPHRDARLDQPGGGVRTDIAGGRSDKDLACCAHSGSLRYGLLSRAASRRWRR